jgi:hypothetical protein
VVIDYVIRHLRSHNYCINDLEILIMGGGGGKYPNRATAPSSVFHVLCRSLSHICGNHIPNHVGESNNLKMQKKPCWFVLYSNKQNSKGRNPYQFTVILPSIIYPRLRSGQSLQNNFLGNPIHNSVLRKLNTSHK